ncbi:MAG: SDR family oxidoreductase, partial [Candidatus Jordarchaeaceae archaeon]
MKVLVTGGAGYIGSVLVELLLDSGYEVTCLDRLFFGRDTLKSVINHPKFRVIQDDIRWFDPKILEGIDIVLDLAALSNDPTGELDSQKTLEINYKGRVRVAKLAKEKGVERYILASSCSVYGFQDGLLNESSPTNPLTTYAKANLLAEQEILPLADDNFTALALRQATVYGLSPRMRFDLAINGMTLGFFKNGKIPILRDGNQWRPFVHVRDTSRAFILAMEAPKEKVSGEVFNVGANDQNYQIFPLAKLVAESVGLPFEYEWYGSPDYRSYQVSFDKIREVLKFKPQYTPREGAREIY